MLVRLKSVHREAIVRNVELLDNLCEATVSKELLVLADFVVFVSVLLRVDC